MLLFRDGGYLLKMVTGFTAGELDLFHQRNVESAESEVIGAFHAEHLLDFPHRVSSGAVGVYIVSQHQIFVLWIDRVILDLIPQRRNRANLVAAVDELP